MSCETYKMFLGTLADETKLSMLQLLEKGPRTVGDISKQLNFEQSRVSHNLKKLKNLGFVDSEVKGKSRVYRLDEKTIKPLLKLSQKHVDTYYKHYCKCNQKREKL